MILVYVKLTFENLTLKLNSIRPNYTMKLFFTSNQKKLSKQNSFFSQSCNHDKCVQIKDYEAIFEDLPGLQENWTKVLLGKKYAYSGGASYAVFGLISESKRKLELSPVMLMKAQKNEVRSFVNPLTSAISNLNFVQLGNPKCKFYNAYIWYAKIFFWCTNFAFQQKYLYFILFIL